MEIKDIIKFCSDTTCSSCAFNNYNPDIEDVECYFELLPGYWDENDIERRLENYGKKEEN